MFNDIKSLVISNHHLPNVYINLIILIILGIMTHRVYADNQSIKLCNQSGGLIQYDHGTMECIKY